MVSYVNWTKYVTIVQHLLACRIHHQRDTELGEKQSHANTHTNISTTVCIHMKTLMRVTGECPHTETQPFNQLIDRDSAMLIWPLHEGHLPYGIASTF